MALTPSPVSEREIAHRLQTGWGMEVAGVTQLYSGTGGDTWTFRVDTAAESYFLKLRKTVFEPGIAVSLLLSDSGAPVVAPILSLAGRAWEPLTGYLLLAYPLIDGSPIDPDSMTELDWHSIGIVLRAVHGASLPTELRDALTSERTFIPWGEEFLPRIGPALSNLGDQGDPFQQELAKVWSQQGTFPKEFFSFVQAQGHAAIATSPVFCLCHNDFQAQNILKSAPGMVWLIDWDFPMWAPPEKDLIFIAPEHRAQFERGYGALNLNELVMVYQTTNWLLQDLFDCVDRILFRSVAGTEEKRWAIDLAKCILSRMRPLFPS